MTFAYRHLLFTALTALSAVGCGAGAMTTNADSGITYDAGPGCATVPTYAQLLSATFVPRCSGRCHGGANSPPTPTSPAGPIDLSASSKRDQLVNRASIHGMGLVLAVPGDPGSSFLLHKLTNNLPTDGSQGSPMPMGEAILWQMIPQTEIDAITCWIAGGAP
jgi:hypothetical protein